MLDRLEVADFNARSELDAGAVGHLQSVSDKVLTEICRDYNTTCDAVPSGYQTVGTLTIHTSSGQAIHSNRTGTFERYAP